MPFVKVNKQCLGFGLLEGQKMQLENIDLYTGGSFYIF